MRYSAAYLIYAAVLIRALGWMQDTSPIPMPIWVLLAVFGGVLITEPVITRRLAWYPRLYALIQSGLVISMLYTAPTFDFLPMLFFSLSFQVVQFFHERVGFAWIGAFSLAMAGMPLFGLDWQDGVIMILSNSGVNLLMGSYAHLMARTETARKQNQQRFGELQEAYRRLKDYASQLEELATVEERHRLVRELHDSLTQTLFSMNLAAQAAQLSAGKEPEQVDGHLDRLQTLARGAAGEVQALTDSMRSHSYAQGGLVAALRQLVEERQTQDGLQITLEVSGTRELPEPTTMNLYRIVQEAINNIAKHAGTRQAAVRLHLAEGLAWLEVEDQGRGFDANEVDRQGGFGLSGMAERAQEIGWELAIEAHPGQGTRIRVTEAAV